MSHRRRRRRRPGRQETRDLFRSPDLLGRHIVASFPVLGFGATISGNQSALLALLKEGGAEAAWRQAEECSVNIGPGRRWRGQRSLLNCREPVQGVQPL